MGCFCGTVGLGVGCLCRVFCGFTIWFRSTCFRRWFYGRWVYLHLLCEHYAGHVAIGDFVPGDVVASGDDGVGGGDDDLCCVVLRVMKRVFCCCVHAKVSDQ